MKYYFVKMALRGISPMVWRHLQIPGNVSLAKLHYIIQIVYGWDNEHLHQFHIHGKDYGISYLGGIAFSDNDYGHCAGLSLQESKKLLKRLQQKIVLHQAKIYTLSHRNCPCCQKPQRSKGNHSIQFKTLFGTVVIPSLRVYPCKCSSRTTKTFSLLKSWLPEHISPELQYIETKWASHMSFNKTSTLLQDVLPVTTTHNGASVRNHLHKIAQKQESALEGKPICISGCANQWAKLPKPDKPITVGIDGGYVRSWSEKKNNFEVIIGKSFLETKPPKPFLSDGADNVRDLQFIMHPEVEHVLDWFHLTMRFTVLNQFAKGLVHSDPEAGDEVTKNLSSAKWYIWHGNVKESLDHLEDCYMICDQDGIHYKNQKKFLRNLEEMTTYIENNRNLIPNYGERWRYNETIASSFVESTMNEVVTKRMVKKQQMQWSDKGAHYLLQARTSTLNGDLPKYFEDWYPGLKINRDHEMQAMVSKKAA